MGSLVAARLGRIILHSFLAVQGAAGWSSPGSKHRRGDSSSEYQSRASLILDYLQTFWNEEEGFMTETTVTDVMRWGRSGKGSVPITVSVLNFDPTLGCDSATFQPCSDRALSNLKVIRVFAKIFIFVQNLPPDEPRVFFGYCPEEQMFGGHVRQ